MNKLTEDIEKKIQECSHRTSVILLDRENKKVIGNVCNIYSMNKIEDIKDDIWHLCNWGCWNGTMQFSETVDEHKTDEYRVSDDGQTFMIPLENDCGFVDHNIMFVDGDNPQDVKFWVAQSFGWVYVDTIAQALSISQYTEQKDIA